MEIRATLCAREIQEGLSLCFILCDKLQIHSVVIVLMWLISINNVQWHCVTYLHCCCCEVSNAHLLFPESRFWMCIRLSVTRQFVIIFISYYFCVILCELMIVAIMLIKQYFLSESIVFSEQVIMVSTLHRCLVLTFSKCVLLWVFHVACGHCSTSRLLTKCHIGNWTRVVCCCCILHYLLFRQSY